ncbi:MAG: thioredoxin [Balneolales bacterium]
MESKAKMDKFTEQIMADKPVLVDFYTEWCGPCQSMPHELNKLKHKLGDAISIIKVDIDHNKRVAATYNVRSVPTMMLFHNGKVRWRQTGITSASQLETVISKHNY